jgi:hypothetical protein
LTLFTTGRRAWKSGEREAVTTSELVMFRYPTGTPEYRLGTATPKVGDTLKRGDDEWRVARVETDSEGNTIVTLAPPEYGTTRLES